MDATLQLWGRNSEFCFPRKAVWEEWKAAWDLWEVQISRNRAPLENAFKIVSVR